MGNLVIFTDVNGVIMNVKELIEILETMNPNYKVIFESDTNSENNNLGVYSFGIIKPIELVREDYHMRYGNTVTLR